jgi:hypothetical protein
MTMTMARRFSVMCALLVCGATTIYAQSNQSRSDAIAPLPAAVAREQEALAALLFRYPQVEAIAADYDSSGPPSLRIIINHQRGGTHADRQVPLQKDLAEILLNLKSLEEEFKSTTGFVVRIVHIESRDDAPPLKALSAHVGGSTSNTAGCFEGTIGAAVVDRRDGQRKGFVTCNHVAGAEGPLLCPNGEESEEVVPGMALTGCHPGLSIGQLVRRHPISVVPNVLNEADAAFVEADDVHFDDLRFCQTGEYYLPQDTPSKLKVRKYGAGSGYKDNGIVTSWDVMVNVPFLPCGPTAAFGHQILVEGAQFGISGDSGAAVLDEHGKAVGMIFAGDESGNTYVNPMNQVLDLLHVDLLKCPLR